MKKKRSWKKEESGEYEESEGEDIERTNTATFEGEDVDKSFESSEKEREEMEDEGEKEKDPKNDEGDYSKGEEEEKKLLCPKTVV